MGERDNNVGRQFRFQLSLNFRIFYSLNYTTLNNKTVISFDALSLEFPLTFLLTSSPIHGGAFFLFKLRKSRKFLSNQKSHVMKWIICVILFWSAQELGSVARNLESKWDKHLKLIHFSNNFSYVLVGLRKCFCWKMFRPNSFASSLNYSLKLFAIFLVRISFQFRLKLH